MRVKHFLPVAIAIMLPVAAWPQIAQSAAGSSQIYSFFDPTARVPTPRLPEIAPGAGYTVVPRPPIVQQGQGAVQPRIPSVSPATTPAVPVQALSNFPTLSFEGLPNTKYIPPSTNIAAGPEDVLQIENAAIARYDKSGTRTDAVDLQQTWFQKEVATVCPSTQCTFGDVSVRYDQMHGHFIITLQVLDTNASASSLLISVSKGATYASGFKNWTLDLRKDGTTQTNNWGDFPQVGLDNDALYVTVLMFDFQTFTFQYSKVRIIRKIDLYNTTATTLPYFDFFNLKNEDNTTASTLQTPHLRGRVALPANGGVMINASDQVDADYMTLWHIANVTSGTPTLSRSTLHGFIPYRYPAAAPQLNSTVTLATGPSSIAKVVMREGKLYLAQNVGYTDAPTTVTYALIDPLGPSLLQQTRWTGGNYFYPAFDIPASLPDLNHLPANLVVGTTTSLGGGLTYAGITNLKSGEGVYDTGTPTARWGDYNGAGIDPVTGGMWVSAEYAKAPQQGIAIYGTWNAYFPWITWQTFNDVDLTDADFNYINVMKYMGMTTGCSIDPPLFCPTMGASRATLAVFTIRAMFGDSFTYTTTPYFTDVPASDPNFAYIQKARDLGLTQGCSDTAFCPAMQATRRMAATFVIRAKMGNLFGPNNFPYPTTAYFTDVPSTDASFPFVQKFREMGMTAGCTATAFCPDSPLTREQLAVFMVRAFFN